MVVASSFLKPNLISVMYRLGGLQYIRDLLECVVVKEKAE